MWGRGDGANERAQTKTEWVSMKVSTLAPKKTNKKKQKTGKTNDMQENNTSKNGNEKQVMDGNEEHTNDENKTPVH